jgi:excisionase family DNA binding protein
MPGGRPPGRTGSTRPQSQGEQPLYTAREVARRYRVDDTTVRRWVKDGALQAVKLPHKGQRSPLRFTADHIKSFDPAFEG